MENFEIMSADDFFSKYGELAGQRLMFGRPAAVKHCSANVFGDCVAGTLLIPDKKDTEKVRLRCGFRLDGDRLLIIDDDGQAEKIMREVQDGGSIDGAGAAFIMFSLIEYVIRDDLLFLDGYDKKLDAGEDMVTDGSRGIPDDFDGYLSQHRKNLRDLASYYKLLADVVDELEAFMSRTGNERDRQFFAYLGNRIDRLYQDVMGMAEYVMQIRDIHQSRINAQQNKVMQILTIVTTIFMPLTLITGWYGMNFRNMPELDMPWAYGIVIAAAVIVVIVEIIIFKKKKWF